MFAQMYVHLANEIESLMEQGKFSDILGDLFHKLGLGNEKSGQFFTPDNIAELMAMITINKDSINREKGYITLLEPTCGSGVMVIQAAKVIGGNPYEYQRKMVAMAVDTDILCVHMCFVQLSLYGIPAVVIHGNSITDETWSRWYTSIYLLNNWIWKETLTLNGKPCIEDIQIKSALDSVYSSIIQFNSLFSNADRDVSLREYTEHIVSEAN